MRIKDSETPLYDQESSFNEDSSELFEHSHRSNSKTIGKWTAEEDDLLRKYVPLYGEKQWRKISNHIQGRTSIQCLHRWTKILKPGLVKGPWTSEEDQKLMNWVKREGPTKWAQASNFIIGRSGKQCRERWFNNLNPNVKKGNWSKEEDELIFELYQKHGSSWSKIAKFIPGRTENAIKNRFYSTLRRLTADKKKLKEDHLEEEVKQNEVIEEVCNVQSYIEGELPAPANTLYKLLQEKTGNGDQTDPIMGEMSMKEGKEIMSKIKTKQSSQINGKKLLVKRENVNEITYDYTSKFGTTFEKQDDDVEFEKFLLGIDNQLGDDFLSKEFETEREEPEIGEFEDLQQKILKYCQTNISILSDTFKNVSNNPFEQSSQQKYQNGLKQRHQISPSIISMSQKIDNFYQQNIHGINPLTSISNVNFAGKKPFIQNNDGHGQGFLAQSMNSPYKVNNNLHTEESFSPGKVLYNETTFLQNYTNQYDGNREDNSFEKWNHNKWENSKVAQEAGFNHLLDTAHSIETHNGRESEKKLTFLFQQLYSLEDLLKNAKNELMKLESTFNKEKKNDLDYFSEINNKENTLNEEKFVYEKDIWTSSMNFMNDGVEQIVKKRKYSR